MDEPSSSPSEHLDADRGPLTEAIQLYQVEHAMLLAHQREVERRRAAVRTAAEQEASEILLAARREIRRVLVRTRHELVALTAQVRAAGCEAAPAESDQSIVGDDFQLSPARDVRNLLRDARSELLNLSRDPANLSPAGEEPQRLAPPVAIATPPESAAAGDFWSPGTHQESSDGAEDFREEVPATGLTEQFVRYWRPAAALAILVVVATAIVALRPSSKTTEADLKVRTTAALTTSPAGAGGSTASGPAAEAPVARAAATAPNASRPAIDASGTGGSEMLSLTLDVRRPVWLRINADGGLDPGRMYQEGERRTIRASRDILLRAGDAGAVLVSLGGGAPMPLGPDGLVRERRFARGGSPATDPAVPLQMPVRTSEVRPLESVVATRGAAGTEPGAPPTAPVAKRTPAETSTTDHTQRAATADDHDPTAEREILERHQRWFDAFERGDRAAMASIASENFSLVDQRPERVPAVSGRVERTIQDLRVQVTGGVGAVLSGRIAETTADAEATVAMLSEVWIRRGEEWRLVSVRMVPVNAVPSTLQ